MAKTVAMCLKSMRKYRMAFVQLPHLVLSYNFRGSIHRSTTLHSVVFMRKGIRNSSEYSMFSASRIC
jgi:hypothetical protein